MFRYILKQYLRNFSRRKIFSIINITGLAFAVAFIILIGQLLFYEFNYNHSLKNIDNIYRLVDEKHGLYNLNYKIKDQILGSITGVKNVCLLNHFSVDANVQNKFFEINNMLITDPNFFKMFNVQFVLGNPDEALNSVDDVVLTESTAKRIFGTINVIGKTLMLDHDCEFNVSGVVNDLPANISFAGDLFVSFQNSISNNRRLAYKILSFSDDSSHVKRQIFFNVFVELKDKALLSNVENQISSLSKINSSFYPKEVRLAPLKTNYFDTSILDPDLIHGNAGLMKILSIIGMIILMLAIINFLNLATSSFKYRLTEISVKKCFGAGRKTLIQQLLIESFFNCAISSFIGIALAEVFLPYFNKFIEKPIPFQLFGNLNFLSLFILFILLLSLSAGLLPAIILSKIAPVQLFKAGSYLRSSGRNYRNILTMFQFSISIILISILIVITRQIDFVKHQDLGFNTERLLYLRVHYTLKNRIQVLADKLYQYHGIVSLTKTFGMPGSVNFSAGDNSIIFIDTNTINTFGFNLIRGRNLTPSDEGNYALVNQTELKNLGGGDYKKYKIGRIRIAGVVADFNFSSLYNKIEPLALMYDNNFEANCISLRIREPINKAIDYIKKTWEEVCPDYPIEFGFYDDYFASMYKKEEDLASLISIFSILAVVISCLGIFGLSIFQSEQKIKEIGIRKVLGASRYEILLLLTKNFSKWVIASNIIAAPVAYYLMNRWLQDFAYKIIISWWMFALAGCIALVIAFATVSFHAIKAATANPVKSLRYE